MKWHQIAPTVFKDTHNECICGGGLFGSHCVCYIVQYHVLQSLACLLGATYKTKHKVTLFLASVCLMEELHRELCSAG